MKGYKEFIAEESKPVNVNEFVKNIDSVIRKTFDKSNIVVKHTKGMAESVTVYFTIGSGKSEYANGISENDTLKHVIHLWLDTDSDGNISGSISAESSSGRMSIADPTGRMAFLGVKTGWRNKKGTPEVITKHIDSYFKKVMTVFKENKDKMADNDKKLVGSKY